MREIKFRAWDKRKNGGMFTGITLYSHVLSETGVWMGTDDGAWDYPNEKYVVWMQYTGLKDRNGKEIYEGDIVGFKKDKRNKKWSEIVEVKIDDGLLTPFYEEEFSNYDGTWNYLVEYNHYEVIGNKYENPELLTNK